LFEYEFLILFFLRMHLWMREVWFCRNSWLQKGLNGTWTQFALNRNHQPRQKYISTDKTILYWFTLISWATSNSPLNKPFKRFHYSANSYNEYTNLSRLQRVHKPLQVITSTQTYPGYHEYTNLSRLYQSQSPPEIKTTQDWNKHSQKREQWKLTRVYLTMVKNYTMVSTTQNSICSL